MNQPYYQYIEIGKVDWKTFSKTENLHKKYNLRRNGIEYFERLDFILITQEPNDEILLPVVPAKQVVSDKELLTLASEYLREIDEKEGLNWTSGSIKIIEKFCEFAKRSQLSITGEPNKEFLFKAIEKIDQGHYGSAKNFIELYVNTNLSEPTGEQSEAVDIIKVFDSLYEMYHDKGLTSTAYRFIESIGLEDKWKEFLKKQQTKTTK